MVHSKDSMRVAKEDCWSGMRLLKLVTEARDGQNEFYRVYW